MGDNEPHTNGVNGGGESDDEVNIHGSDGICDVSNQKWSVFFSFLLLIWGLVEEVVQEPVHMWKWVK